MPLELGPLSTREQIQRASIPPRAESERMAEVVPGFVLPPGEENAGVGRTFRAVLAALPRMEKGSVFAQIEQQGIGSMVFILVVLAFVGAILVYQAGVQALRVVPDTSTIGASYLEVLTRDLASTLTALMLATRVGAGIAAEIGGMKVTDQLDALRLSNADPVVTLVAPRIVASLFYTPILTMLGGATAVVSGLGTGFLAFEINPTTFLDPRFIDTLDITMGLTKSFAFGLAVPLFSAHAGLRTQGGSQGVGDATTKAVVSSSLAVIILGFVIGAVFEVLGGHD
jgi:phospholipid/cholesterol/gamma-HCH transport system permease protein